MNTNTNREFNYFYGQENENFLFLQVPKVLYKDPYFKDLSHSAIILYSLLLERTGLSMKNNWRDEEGRVYIIYTIDEIMEDLKCWEKKAIKIMKDLQQFGLIKVIRRGLGKPNLIYVMNFSTDLKYQTKNTEKEQEISGKSLNCEKDNSMIVKNANQEIVQSAIKQVRKAQRIYTYNNKKNFKKIDSNEIKSTSDENFKKTKPKPADNLTNDDDYDFVPHKESKNNSADNIPAYDYNIYKAIIYKNISYDHFKKHTDIMDMKLIDELVECMLDVITTKGKNVKINSEMKDRQIVINRYLSLNASDIEHIVMKYQQQEQKITHIQSYLKTLLYTVKLESNFYNDNNFREQGSMLRYL
jgi:hypothetical protein